MGKKKSLLRSFPPRGISKTFLRRSIGTINTGWKVLSSDCSFFRLWRLCYTVGLNGEGQRQSGLAMFVSSLDTIITLIFFHCVLTCPSNFFLKPIGNLTMKLVYPEKEVGGLWQYYRHMHTICVNLVMNGLDTRSVIRYE